MLITAGIVALGQKAAEAKAKRKEKKEKEQGVMQVGDSDVAERAFASQTSRMIENGSAAPARAGTGVKFEDPTDIQITSPSQSSGLDNVQLRDARSTSQVDITSPAQSEMALLSPGTAATETPTSPRRSGESSTQDYPPPYMSTNSSIVPTSPSIYSQETLQSKAVPSDARSISTRSTNSRGTHALRIKTRGPDLKSGFAYHPALFDLRVHPEQWENFTSEVVNSTKLSASDHAKVWGAATGVALSGAIVTSVFVGSSLKRTANERRVKEGLENTSAGSLGDKLRLWNEEYFSKQGLFVHLELSEAAMKNNGRSNALRKPTAFFAKGEERERKEDERKFVIVVTKLDEDGQPMEAIKELNAHDGPAEIGSSDPGPAEIGSSDPTSAVAELPADVSGTTSQPVELPADMNVPVELPAETTSDKNKPLPLVPGPVEMSSDNTRLLEKLDIEDPTRRGENAPFSDKLHVEDPTDRGQAQYASEKT